MKRNRFDFAEFFKDMDGNYSSKRLVTYISAIVLIITWASNLWYGMQITEFIYEGFLYIVVVGLGVTTAEKFSRKSSYEQTPTDIKTQKQIANDVPDELS